MKVAASPLYSITYRDGREGSLSYHEGLREADILVLYNYYYIGEGGGGESIGNGNRRVAVITDP